MSLPTARSRFITATYPTPVEIPLSAIPVGAVVVTAPYPGAAPRAYEVEDVRPDGEDVAVEMRRIGVGSYTTVTGSGARSTLPVAGVRRVLR
jgi:hypothetical protein